jgi:hypothetical protein
MDKSDRRSSTANEEHRVERISKAIDKINEEYKKFTEKEISLSQFNEIITPSINDLYNKVTSKWKLYIYFIVIIALLGGSVAFLIHYIFTGLIHVPIIQAQITFITDNENSNAVIQVTNEGKQPATNLNLTIKIPENKNLKTFPNVTSVDAKWNIISPTYMKAHIKEFVHGTGTIIQISIPIINNQTMDCSDYSVYAVYEEGSTKGFCTAFDILYQFHTLDTSIKIGILITLTIILSSILFILIPKYMINFSAKRKRR